MWLDNAFGDLFKCIERLCVFLQGLKDSSKLALPKAFAQNKVLDGKFPVGEYILTVSHGWGIGQIWWHPLNWLGGLFLCLFVVFGAVCLAWVWNRSRHIVWGRNCVVSGVPGFWTFWWCCWVVRGRVVGERSWVMEVRSWVAPGRDWEVKSWVVWIGSAALGQVLSWLLAMVVLWAAFCKGVADVWTLWRPLVYWNLILVLRT